MSKSRVNAAIDFCHQPAGRRGGGHTQGLGRRLLPSPALQPEGACLLLSGAARNVAQGWVVELT